MKKIYENIKKQIDISCIFVYNKSVQFLNENI